MAVNNRFIGHKLFMSSKAAKQLKKIPLISANKIRQKMKQLVAEDSNLDVKKMQDRDDTYRLRVGCYRIVFEHQKKIITVLVMEVGHRKEIYKGI